MINQKSAQVFNLVATKHNIFTMDPVTIALIIQILIAIFEFLKKWKSPESAMDILNNPGIVAKVTLRAIMSRYAYSSPYYYDIRDAIYKVGEEVTLYEVKEAYSEV
jgi:hypothetical protein